MYCGPGTNHDTRTSSQDRDSTTTVVVWINGEWAESEPECSEDLPQPKSEIAELGAKVRSPAREDPDAIDPRARWPPGERVPSGRDQAT